MVLITFVFILVNACIADCFIDIDFLEPEVTMILPDMVAYYGYPLEVHKVTTKDGYILTNHRIPHGRNNITADSTKLPILLFHGIYLRSDVWLSNTPNNSIGFLLADAGYDVWIINTRGNVYSQEHVSLKSNQDEFWNFSVDDLANDTTAFIDYVINKTGKGQVIILGFSLGGWMPFITLSTFPQYNDKVNAIYAIAPVANFEGVHVNLRILFKVFPPILRWLKTIGIHTINLAPPWIPLKLVGIFSKLFQPLMERILKFFLGPTNTFNSTRLPVYITHINGGAASNFLLYFSQVMDNPGLRHFDWGQSENLVRYGQTTPPDYDLQLVKVPAYFYYGTNDYLTSKANVQSLYNKIANPINMSSAGQEWNHISYFYSTDASSFSNELIIDMENTKN